MHSPRHSPTHQLDQLDQLEHRTTAVADDARKLDALLTGAAK